MLLVMEKTCVPGRRMVSSFFIDPFIFIHAVVVNAALWTTKENHMIGIIVLNVLVDIVFIIQYQFWVRFGTDDFSQIKLTGKYKVGFMRIKSSHGNDCMVFYPCDQKCQE